MSNYYNNRPYQNNYRQGQNRSSSIQPASNNRNMLNFNNDFFFNNHFGNLGGAIDSFDDPFDDFFGGFRNMHQNMISNFMNQMNFGFEDNNGSVSHQVRGGFGGPGTVISKSYVKKIDYSSGQPVEESYQSQSIKQYGKDGHKIHEKQEAYKNSAGIEKAAHQRLLDDRGQKCIKQRNRRTGEQEMKNIYKGINEGELEDFNKKYNEFRQKSDFQKNYELLKKMNYDCKRIIGDGRQRHNNGAPVRALPGNGRNMENTKNIGQLPQEGHNYDDRMMNQGNNEYISRRKSNNNYNQKSRY